MQTASGDPFLIHGDTAWSLAVQLTRAQIDTYLDDRQTKGFTAILFSAIEHGFSDQTPTYENAEGNQPFTTATDFASPNEDYWDLIDYIVDGAQTRSMVCIINPAYLGFSGGDQGWMSEVSSETDADLQTYGAFLANRYTQGNIIWCLGGDYAGTTTERNKQWNIVTGMRSVRTTDIICAHSGPNTPGYESWDTFTGWNLNTVYCYPDDGIEVYSESANEYARSGPIPFIQFESRYEQEDGVSSAQLRRQSYQALLSGACGQIFGNNPIWHFESPNAIFSYTGTWESNLDSTGSTQQQYVKALFDAYDWHLLVPTVDTSLVTTSLGTGSSRICPALASDGSFAMIWRPASGAITIDMTAFTPESVRARFYDPTDGTYATVTGSPFSNTGTQDITFPAERVLVLDAA